MIIYSVHNNHRFFRSNLCVCARVLSLMRVWVWMCAANVVPLTRWCLLLLLLMFSVAWLFSVGTLVFKLQSKYFFFFNSCIHTNLTISFSYWASAVVYSLPLSATHFDFWKGHNNLWLNVILVNSSYWLRFIIFCHIHSEGAANGTLFTMCVSCACLPDSVPICVNV